MSLIGPAAIAAAQPPEMVNVIIGFDRQPGLNEEGIVRGAGGNIKYTYRLVPAIAASVPQTAIEALTMNSRVTRVEPDIEVHAVDAELDNTWGVKRIGAGTVHGRGNRGTGVRVAIIDSGVDYNHADLNANYAGGYDFVNSDNDPMDDDGHGTHVAGTVAARDNDVGVVGVAPEARIYALKVLDASGSGSYSHVIAALQWAVDNGIQVTNNSYGSSGNPGTIVKDAFDSAYAAGVLHVAAAGNEGIPPGFFDNVIYPARWASVIAVAATNNSDSRASFSSTGPDVELAAPGVAINSTKLGGGYIEFQGTSMASPHVAGAAALVIASGIADANGNGFINDEVRQRLTATADDLGAAGRDTWYGYGLVNAANAATLTTHTATATNSPTSATTNTSTAFTLTVTSGGFSTNRISKVELTVDASFTVVAAGTPPTNWTASAVGNVITWTTANTGAMINPGSAKTFAWSATSGSAGSRTHTWVTTGDAVPPSTASGWVTTTVAAAVDFNALAALALAVPAYLFWRWKLRRRRTSAGS